MRGQRKSLQDHMRFSIAYWHTFCGTGSDPFGPGTAVRPWEAPDDSVENAKNRARVGFEYVAAIERAGAGNADVIEPGGLEGVFQV